MTPIHPPLRSLFAVLLLTFFLAGCQAGEAKDKETVSFMLFGDPPEQAAFESVVDGFQAANRDVRVEMIGMPGKEDYMTRLTADFAAGTPPDVFLLNYRRVAQFYNNDALEPLGPLLQASERLQEEAYYAVALDAFRDSQGTLICIPQNISSQVVYYNKDMFDAAGRPYPDPNWNWQDFRETAVALTLPDNDQDGQPDQYGLGLEPRIIRLAALIWQNNGELVDDVEKPTRLTLDAPEAMGAMAHMLALSLDDGVVPNHTSEAVQSHGDRFLSGNIAMYVNSRRIVPTTREVAAFNWDVVPLPRGEEAATVLHSDGYCMAAGAANKEAAWQFIEYATGEEGQKLASRLGRTVPSLRHVAESPAFLDPSQAPANSQAWLDVVPYLRTLPRLENWAEIERTAAIELELAYMGQQPLSFAISNIQETAARDFVPLK